MPQRSTDRERLSESEGMFPAPHTVVRESRSRFNPEWRQCLSISVASLTMLLVGTVNGWTLASVRKEIVKARRIPLRLIYDESSWIVPLTGMIGSLVAAQLADCRGRKYCLLLTSIMFTSGWFIIYAEIGGPMIYLAWVILGIAVGIAHTINPMYVSEIADINNRGALSTIITANFFFGKLLTCAVALWLTNKPLLLFLVTVSFISMCLNTCFPETPYFLAAKGKKQQACKSIEYYKGIVDPQIVNVELRALRAQARCKSHLESSYELEQQSRGDLHSQSIPSIPTEVISEKHPQPTGEVRLQHSRDTPELPLQPQRELRSQSTSELHRPPTSQIYRTPICDIHRSPTNQIYGRSERELTRWVTNQIYRPPTSRIHLPPTSQIHLSSTSAIHPEPTSEMHRQSTSQVQPEPRSEIQAPSTSQIHRPSTSAIHPEPTSEMHRQSTSQVQPEPRSEIQVPFTSQTHRPFTSAIHPEPTSELHRPPTSQIYRTPICDIHRSPTNQIYGRSERELTRWVTNQIYRPPTSRIHLPPTSQIHLSSTSAIHPEPTSEMHRQSTSQVQPEPRSEIQAPSTSQIHRPSTSAIHPEPTSEMHRQSTSQVQPEPRSEIQALSTSQIHRPSTSAIHPEPTSEMHRQITSQAQPAPTSEIQEPSTSQIHRPSTSQTYRPSLSEVHRPPTSQIYRPPSHETFRSSTGQIDERSIRELLQSATNEIYRPSTSQIRRSPTSQIHRPSTSAIHLEPTSEMHRQSTSQVLPEPRSEIQVPSTSQIHRPSTSAIHPESTSEMHRQSTSQAQPEPTSEIQAPSTSQIHRPSTSQTHRPSTSEIQPEPRSETHSEATSEIHTSNLITQSCLTKLKLILQRSNRKALFIMLGLIMAQHLSGNFITVQDLQLVLREAKVVKDLYGGMIAIQLIKFLSNGLTMIMVDLVGRRKLLILSTFGSTLTLTIRATYLLLGMFKIDVSIVSLLPVIDLIIYQVLFQIGLGTLPYVLLCELFPTKLTGFVAAIIVIFDYIIGFSVSKLHLEILDKIGLCGTSYIFAIACSTTFLMVRLWVPETKGRTYQQIEALLDGNNLNSSSEEVRSDDEMDTHSI